MLVQKGAAERRGRVERWVEEALAVGGGDSHAAHRGDGAGGRIASRIPSLGSGDRMLVAPGSWAPRWVTADRRILDGAEVAGAGGAGG